MCDPLSIATSVMVLSTVTQGVASYTSQQQTYKQQKQQLQDQQNYKAQVAAESQKSYTNDIDALEQQRQQQQQLATDKLTANSIQAAQARATARVSAGESGVSGLSVDALIGDLYRQEGTNGLAIKTDATRAQQQITRQAASAKATAESRYSGVRISQNFTPPNALGTIAGVGAGLANTGVNYLSTQPITTTPRG